VRRKKLSKIADESLFVWRVKDVDARARVLAIAKLLTDLGTRDAPYFYYPANYNQKTARLIAAHMGSHYWKMWPEEAVPPQGKLSMAAQFTRMHKAVSDCAKNPSACSITTLVDTLKLDDIFGPQGYDGMTCAEFASLVVMAQVPFEGAIKEPDELFTPLLLPLVFWMAGLCRTLILHKMPKPNQHKTSGSMAPLLPPARKLFSTLEEFITTPITRRK
jgi:hypothetical protein